MKTRNIIATFLLGIGLASTSCADFDNMNNDPNRVGEDQYNFSSLDLGSALKYGSNMNYIADDGSLAGGGHLFERVRYLGWEAFAQYHDNPGVPANGWVEDYWKAQYSTWLSLLNGVISSSAIFENTENLESIALIWRAYIQSNASDYFGPMPFTFDVANDNPDYMPLDELYKGLFNDLDKAVRQFDPKKEIIVAEDYIFGGDIAKWKKFANTLRLRFAMKISETDPELAKAQIGVALAADGGLLEFGEDVVARPYAGWAEGSAYGDLGWNTYNMTTTMEKMLTGIGGTPYTGAATGVHPAIVDPRGELMFDPSPTGSNWTGMNVAPRESGLDAVSAVMSVANLKSQTNRSTGLATYTEVCFLLAEAVERGFVTSAIAGGTAKEWYEKGVKSSFNRWNISGAATAYLNSVAVNEWGTSAKYDDAVLSPGNSNLEKIVTQRYIAFYPDLSLQIWNDKRRLNLPAMDIPEVQNDGAGSWPKDGNIYNPANYAQRALYPQSENLLNKDKYQVGISQLGGLISKHRFSGGHLKNLIIAHLQNK